MKKYNPHSNRTHSHLVPAPKSQKPLIVAAGTIRAGTVYSVTAVEYSYLTVEYDSEEKSCICHGRGILKTRTYGSESATGQPTIMTEINKNNFQFIWGLFELF